MKGYDSNQELKDIFRADNMVMKRQKLYNQKQAVFNVPAVYVNDQMYKGNLHGSYIFDAVC